MVKTTLTRFRAKAIVGRTLTASVSDKPLAVNSKRLFFNEKFGKSSSHCDCHRSYQWSICRAKAGS